MNINSLILSLDFKCSFHSLFLMYFHSLFLMSNIQILVQLVTLNVHGSNQIIYKVTDIKGN